MIYVLWVIVLFLFVSVGYLMNLQKEYISAIRQLENKIDLLEYSLKKDYNEKIENLNNKLEDLIDVEDKIKES